ncbi:hypothetical protein Y10_02190 [Neptunitalea sp. Y10]|uniref:Uncharacterized protein n=1 Tax=Neptunitalea lumnitzerae TaxID=2965509 RepID=A0ABQ5MEM7_9FLAO|nr:hypothetical protein Y10_02190 [Neptunitalea sp. Y10]
MLTLVSNAQSIFELDTDAIENPKEEKPFQIDLEDSANYSTYIADSLALSIGLPDSLVVINTNQNGNPLINIGQNKEHFHRETATTMVIVNTQQKGNPKELITRDILNIYDNMKDDPEHLHELENGKDYINGSEAYWFLTSLTNTDSGNRNSFLGFYVQHPKTQEIYNIFIFTFEPKNYKKQLGTYYNYLQTLQWNKAE